MIENNWWPFFLRCAPPLALWYVSDSMSVLWIVLLGFTSWDSLVYFFYYSICMHGCVVWEYQKVSQFSYFTVWVLGINLPFLHFQIQLDEILLDSNWWYFVRKCVLESYCVLLIISLPSSRILVGVRMSWKVYALFLPSGRNYRESV